MTYSPKRLTVDWNATPLHGEEFREQLAQTYEGQAHFAGTGPAGAQCKGCFYWGDDMSRALSRPCIKFCRLTGVITKVVPGTALACRHFKQRDSK